jgi:4,5-dihydroxyphthalate decarboxylase
MPQPAGRRLELPIMTARRLHTGISVNDRMLPLLTGAVTSPDLVLDFERATPIEIFQRAIQAGAFDVTEMSLAAHAIMTSRGDNPFVGLPVFTSRMFRHGSIFVSARSGISTPEQLAGRRIGIPEYQMTAAVWVRGLLHDQYGVDLASIDWHTGGVNQVGRGERIPLRLPPSYRVTPVAPSQTLNQMLLDGDIDAIIAPQIPAAFRSGDPRIRRLFSDFRRAEEAYFDATGLFPIMHLVVMRKELAAAEPELLPTLYDLFERAKAHSRAALADGDALFVMLPTLISEIEATTRRMGEDFWAYGIGANRRVLDAFIGHLTRQHLLAKSLSPEDLFAPTFATHA